MNKLILSFILLFSISHLSAMTEGQNHPFNTHQEALGIISVILLNGVSQSSLTLTVQDLKEKVENLDNSAPIKFSPLDIEPRHGLKAVESRNNLRDY